MRNNRINPCLAADTGFCSEGQILRHPHFFFNIQPKIGHFKEDLKTKKYLPPPLSAQGGFVYSPPLNHSGVNSKGGIFRVMYRCNVDDGIGLHYF